MINFFLIAGLFFAILQANNIYYQIILQKISKKQTKKKLTSSSKTKESDFSFLAIIAFIIIVIALVLLMSFVFINLLSQNLFIIYMGIITYGMLTYALYYLKSGEHKLLFALIGSSVLIGIQILLKVPLLGGLLLVLGYIGVVSNVFLNKIISPKIIILFLIGFTLYDFSTVFIAPVQVALAGKTINNIFPAALVVGNITLGTGDVLFALIMTSFTRVYYSLIIAITMGLLLALPMVGIGIFVKLFPQQNIGLPYLVFMTPIFLIILYIMKQKGYKFS